MGRPKKITPDAANDAQVVSVPDAGLIRVQKNGETLDIHPTTLQSHKDAGWKVVE
jgi:hypothetical protein